MKFVSQILGKTHKSEPSAEKLVYFGDHRCASTWFLSVLNTVGPMVKLPVFKYTDWVNLPDRSQPALIANVNAEWSHRVAIGDLRGFHVIRDPRDIVVSAYFSHKFSHPSGDWLDKQREFLQQASQEEGIKSSIDFRASQFKRMAEWNYADPAIYETRYETLVANPLETLRAIFAFLGLYPSRMSDADLQTLVETHSFEKITGGRARGEENTHHHYRKGTPGDWREYFTEAHKQYFKECYGDLLIQLGYEKDNQW